VVEHNSQQMELNKYAVVSDSDHIFYEFLSEGPRGRIRKVIYYNEIAENMFNLSFGDWDETERRINDTIRTNNADRDRVLATVASTVLDFIVHHPGAAILVIGATSSRTRLYQIGLMLYWNDIIPLFDIIGYADGKWLVVQKGKNYTAFLLKAK